MNLCSVIAALTFFLMPSGAILYDTNLEPIVELPAGYFVLLTDEQAPDGYISVAYDDLRGFVKRANVRAVDYTPVTKYELSARFKCDNDGQPVNLRAAPYRSANVLVTLEPNASGRVYGKATGDALIKNGNTLWYYVNVDGVRGYCYYAHVSADDAPPNVI
ncbi:MAG: SH3 domain-containing protein, partial [Clostridiales bacterium]|nr:SH3 domain-containing protein [Clostridiales bacterium]